MSRKIVTFASFTLLTLSITSLAACGGDDDDGPGTPDGAPTQADAAPPEVDAAFDPGASPCEVDDGQCIFRHDTFGDEQLWTDVLRLHEAVATLAPTAALGVGLKVDVDAVPPDVLASADLSDPATTIALIGLDAVVGVRGVVEDGQLTKIGVTCALCHSTVDDSAAPGIGRRLDGWPNRDLDPGAIIALTPGLPVLAEQLGVDPEVARNALESWDPGRYDARFNQDTESHPVLIPPAYGLADVELETYTGEGPISYWNAYVAVTQMGAHGNFVDERLGIEIRQEPDRVTPMLPALRDYQVSLEAPAPPKGTFDAKAAARGEALFAGKAGCAGCHAGTSFTDAPTLHAPAETGMETDEARRSVTGMYRTTPLRGAWQHPPYFHDGSAATLADVVTHYNEVLKLKLTGDQRSDLEQYLLSL
jgi:mono/diheme cytochrome c family protein